MADRSYTLSELRVMAAQLAPAGRDAFPGICGLESSGDGWKPFSLYGEGATLRCVQGVFLRMLDAIEGVTLYRPGSGCEGADFMADWCDRCTKDNLDRDRGGGGCPIIALTMIHDMNDPEYPRAWRETPEGPICTEFADRSSTKDI